VKRPKLGPWLGVIDAILEEDKTRPAKQRHTAKLIFDRLREEHGFSGGYTIVKDYVRTAMLHGREMGFAHETEEAGYYCPTPAKVKSAATPLRKLRVDGLRHRSEV
jgi:hypothetical protein